MPILMMILAAVGGAIWWWARNNPRDAFDVAQDAAVTLKNAPRRLSFRRATNRHPAEGIDDPYVAIGSIAQSFIMLDDVPTRDQNDRLHVQLRSKLRCSDEDAQEMQAFGRWIVEQCNGPEAAISRLIRHLKKLDGSASYSVLRDLLGGVVTNELSSRQQDAVEEIARVMRT